MSLDFEKLNFENCEDEPIHIPEQVQSFGYLVAIGTEDFRIKIYSENFLEILKDKNPLELELFNLLDSQSEVLLKCTFDRVESASKRLPVELRFKEEVHASGSCDYDVVVYRSNEYFVLELEPGFNSEPNYRAKHYIKDYEHRVLDVWSGSKSMKELTQEVAETVRQITHYDRVFVYKFTMDGCGKVISESKVEGMESFLNIHYPAGDIPEQARELYRKNWVRMDPNIDAKGSKLLPAIDESGRGPLDLTHSSIRSMSPIHRQYIKNLGVKATFSISLIAKGRLWGMITCHNREPLYLCQRLRVECENLSQLFSWHLYANQEVIRREKRVKADNAIHYVLEQILNNKSLGEVFRHREKEVLEIMDADGFMYYSTSETVSLGACPRPENILNEFSSGDPLVKNDASEMQICNENGEIISGILHIPLAKGRSDFIAWFRKERDVLEKWVGLDSETGPDASKKERLQPRKHFTVQKKINRGKCKKWSRLDLEMAEHFQTVFLAYSVEVQRKMREELDGLIKLDQSKNQFLAQVAHELKNPLSPIASGVELLQIEKDKNKREKIHQSIHRQLGQLKRMVEDLLDIARVARGQISLRNEIVSLNDIVHFSEETVRELVLEKNHKLTIKLPEQELTFRGDKVRLTQVFSNLLHNAAKYTNPGGEILLIAEEVNDHVSIKIKDNGIGIPKDKLDSIFTVFTQVDPTSDHVRGGLGIGLSLVRGIVEMYGGKVLARSPGPGHGSEFEVLLPVNHEYT